MSDRQWLIADSTISSSIVDMIISPTLRILPRYISATFSNNLESLIIYPVYHSSVSDSQFSAWRCKLSDTIFIKQKLRDDIFDQNIFYTK